MSVLSYSFTSLLKNHDSYSRAVQGQQGRAAWGGFVLNSCASVWERTSVRAPSRQEVSSAREFTPCRVAAEVSDVGDWSFLFLLPLLRFGGVAKVWGSVRLTHQVKVF